MGIFKDGFGAIKGAKELGDYHGGMPSMPHWQLMVLTSIGAPAPACNASTHTR